MQWADFYKNTSLSDIVQNLNRHSPFFEKIINLARNKKVLEIGIGSASFCLFFSWLGFKVTGIDNDDQILKAAAQIIQKYGNQKNIQLRKANAFQLDFSNSQFDVAFSQGFFEHFNNSQINQLLQQQLRCSQYVVISVPSYWHLKKDFGNERLSKIRDWKFIFSNFLIKEIFYYGLTQRRWKYLAQRRPAQICIVIESSAEVSTTSD